MKKLFSARLCALLLCCLLLLPLASPSLLAAESEGSLPSPELSNLTALAGSFLSIHSIEDANVVMARYAPATLLILAAVCFVLALAGYRLFRLAITVGGFAAGWIFASAAYGWVLTLGLIPSPETIPPFVSYIVHILCGLLATVLAHKVVKAGIFLAAAVGAYFFLNSFPLLNTLTDLLVADGPESKYLIARLLLSLLVGVLAVFITRPVLILATATGGGMVAGLSLMVIIGQTASIPLEVGVGLAFAVIGALVQFRTTAKK